MSIYESSIYKSFKKERGMTVEELVVRKLLKENEELRERVKQLLETQDYLFKQHDSDKAEIEKLKGEGKVCGQCGAIAYDPIVCQQAKEIEALKYELSSRTLGELDQNEIWEVMSRFSFKDFSNDLIKFAKAIEKEVRKK